MQKAKIIVAVRKRPLF